MSEYDLAQISRDELLDKLRAEFQGASLVPRSRFRMYPQFVSMIKEGSKKTTIRFRHEGIDYPIRFVMEILESKPKSDYEGETGLQLKITKFAVKKFGELSDEDARNDGFRNADELKKSLQEIYGFIRTDEFVSIYTVGVV